MVGLLLSFSINQTGLKIVAVYIPRISLTNKEIPIDRVGDLHRVGYHNFMVYITPLNLANIRLSGDYVLP